MPGSTPQKTQNGGQNPVIAINMARISNRPENHEMMHKVGPKVCITTATHPGFLGFDQLLQVGIHPMAGRYGGGALDMRETLNPISMFQYTVWRDAKSHEEMHYLQFDTIYELCSHCLAMVVEGPWEPVYEIVASDLPPSIGLSDVPALMMARAAAQQPVPKVALAMRTIAVGDHGVMHGHEADFEQGVRDTMAWLMDHAPGMLGWMLLKQTGVSAIGSFQLDPEGMTKATLGANPPRYATNYGDKPLDYPPIPAATPAQYFVHMEWEAPGLAHEGLGKVLVNVEARHIHDHGVLAHINRGPYYMLFASMMEEGTWRDHLVR